ncbi:uncharacterized protein TRIADDRAFT_31789 [Trichoplax adhaerens]|uniref:JmjC domain-containing protein n=1 Tax=Trichoplax adhaerens TaxID=10228 RepID=B3S9S8_TRIAD|nr:hypothetical protein TRIADDRAFT_31789 [Trichoplax adhaerens]EDV20524.1 hypothetical protein TRIADDRAFT_31789 [Trichoplax adhaerens]|eukprot:XP_002116950.1 hypothetical protein TRIADDRAFT_31789 [Trichoplax adhaerens]
MVVAQEYTLYVFLNFRNLIRTLIVIEFCHLDPDDNFLAMIRGRKRVRLYGCQTQPLYPNPLGSKGRTIQSQVDCDNPDYQKFPLFHNSQCQEYVLESGEMLFIPAFCWHQVTSLDTSISINMFFGDHGDCNYLSKIMKEPYWDAFSYWFLNIIEQNRPLESFRRILANLPQSIDNFFLKQYHEINITSEIREKLIRLVLDYCQLKELPQAEERNGKHPPALKIRGLLWRK